MHLHIHANIVESVSQSLLYTHSYSMYIHTHSLSDVYIYVHVQTNIVTHTYVCMTRSIQVLVIFSLCSLSFLAKRGVKEEIMNFDARKIDHDIRDNVERLLETKKASFDPAKAKRASQAALPLANWVRASVKYSVVLEKVQPLEQEQLGLQK